MQDTLYSNRLRFASGFFDYAEANGFALFPCRADTKFPAVRWKEESSHDPNKWTAWRADDYNLAVNCAASGIIMIDVDASKVPPAQAWKAFTDLAASWGISDPRPYLQSARGGWHSVFRRPADIAASDLRGGGTLVSDPAGEVIGFKNRGYCIAAHSTFEGKPYLFYPDAPEPYECPTALIDLIRLPIVERTVNGHAGVSEPTDVARLVAFLDSHGEFDSEPEWFKALGAIKLACGDTEDGLLVARQITHEDATEESLLSRWSRLATEPRPGQKPYTIASMIMRAGELGQKFHVGKSTKAMFDGVAAIALETNAAIRQIDGMPLTNGQAVVSDMGAPTLDTFLALQTALPDNDAPTLPRNMSDHELHDKLNAAIAAMFGQMRLNAKQLRNMDALYETLSVLSAVHAPTFEIVCTNLRARCCLSDSKLYAAVRRFEIRVARECRTGNGWLVDNRGFPDARNSDNVAVLLKLCGCTMRWNEWTVREEIHGFNGGAWVPFTDAEYNELLVTAASTEHNYHPTGELLKRTINNIARANPHDPLVEKLANLESQWDGKPRLNVWLSMVCGVEGDSYAQTVGRNLIGGLVKRARHPGCKHDETVLFLDSRQGTGKSTLCKILALSDEYHTDSFRFEGSPQNMIPQLAGRWVVELSDLAGQARRDPEYIKSFISTQSDNYTAKYAAYASDHPRRCLFVGTSNDAQPLADATGNRRFLPVRIEEKINLEWLRENVEQLYAEAAVLESRGDTFGIPESLWKVTGDRQEEARGTSAIEDLIYGWLDRPKINGIEGYWFLSADLTQALSDARASTAPRLYSPHLEKIGYKVFRPTIDGRQVRAWTNSKRSRDMKRIDGLVHLSSRKNISTGRVEFRAKSI